MPFISENDPTYFCKHGYRFGIVYQQPDVIFESNVVGKIPLFPIPIPWITRLRGWTDEGMQYEYKFGFHVFCFLFNYTKTTAKRIRVENFFAFCPFLKQISFSGRTTPVDYETEEIYDGK